MSDDIFRSLPREEVIRAPHEVVRGYLFTLRWSHRT